MRRVWAGPTLELPIEKFAQLLDCFKQAGKCRAASGESLFA
jgi:hypothetical protein